MSAKHLADCQHLGLIPSKALWHTAILVLVWLPSWIQAKRRNLLSFGSDTYKKSVIISNRCSNDGAIYFIPSDTNGDYDDCPEAFQFFEYADICGRSIPAGTYEILTIERYGILTFFENTLDDYFTGEYDIVEEYSYFASICIQGSFLVAPEAAPPETSAPPPDDNYGIDPGLVGCKDCTCVRQWCYGYCSGRGSFQSLDCGPSRFDCSCNNNEGYSWNLQLSTPTPSRDPPETSAPPPDDDYGIDPGLVECKDCTCVRQWCYGYCSGRGSFQSLDCGPSRFDCFCNNNEGYSWNLQLSDISDDIPTSQIKPGGVQNASKVEGGPGTLGTGGAMPTKWAPLSWALACISAVLYV